MTDKPLDPMAFVEAVTGEKLQPWQKKVAEAMMQKAQDDMRKHKPLSIDEIVQQAYERMGVYWTLPPDGNTRPAYGYYDEATTIDASVWYVDVGADSATIRQKAFIDGEYRDLDKHPVQITDIKMLETPKKPRVVDNAFTKPQHPRSYKPR